MREESHLEEMRSAIRGDFERLRERRGEQELMRVVETPLDEPAEPERLDEPLEPAAPSLDAAEPVAIEPEETPEADPVPEPRRSWLARFLSP